MKVTAKCWLNYNGVWHKGGESFDVDNIEEIKDYVTVNSEYVSEIFPPDEPVVEPPKRSRGRPKKTED